MDKSYKELTKLKTYAERLSYLSLDGSVGNETFGSNRYVNQKFYASNQWRRIRNEVIIRDNGCDLGIEDMPINGNIYIHHINPLTMDDVVNGSPHLLSSEYLISCSHKTHNAIHYGDVKEIKEHKDRTPNDTCPWKKEGNNRMTQKNKKKEKVITKDVTEKKEDEKLNDLKEVTETEPADVEHFSVEGTINGCKKLNIRVYPRLDSDVLESISNGKSIRINKSESTLNFYKVEVNGQKGYCLKQYVKI